MRAISNNTSGSEGIIIATVEWWFKKCGGEKILSDFADIADPEDFKSKENGTLGRRVCELLPSVKDSFISSIMGNEDVHFLLALALTQDVNKPIDVTLGGGFWDNYKVGGIFHTEVGVVFKSTGFFERAKKGTPRAITLKMAVMRLKRFIAELPRRNEAVKSAVANNPVWCRDQKEEVFPSDVTTVSVRSLLHRIDAQIGANDAFRKAQKDLHKFLMRPDVDDQLLLEAMDVVAVSDIMER